MIDGWNPGDVGGNLDHRGSAVPKPARLCRYRSLAGDGSKWVRDSIVNGRHYFASPLSFNDPFDCRPDFEPRGSAAERLKHCEAWLRRVAPGLGTLKLRKRAQEMLAKQMSPATLHEVRQKYRELSAKSGVLCLSENHSDILMWSHYADHHRGVCLVFNPADPYFDTATRVEYEDVRPYVNLFDSTRIEMLNTSTRTKSSHWKYEGEWRIFKNSDGVFTASTVAPVQVILGAEIAPKHAEDVGKWIAEATTKISVVSASLSTSKFEVVVPEIWQRE